MRLAHAASRSAGRARRGLWRRQGRRLRRRRSRCGSAPTTARARASGDMIDEFARQARALSGGRIRIEGDFQAAGNEPRPVRPAGRAHGRRAGELDLGVIPARAWDTEGVTSLRAVHAPFLVDSEALMAKIAPGRRWRASCCPGSTRPASSGSRCCPEALRHPFGFGRPLTAPADFAGRTIRAPRSEDSFALLRALGATPTDDPDFNVKVEVAARSPARSRRSRSRAGCRARRSCRATSRCFPKFQTLVIGRKAWEKLDDQQRQTLREAARRTVGQVVDEAVPEIEAARRYCQSGGTVVVAPPEDVKAHGARGAAGLRAARARSAHEGADRPDPGAGPRGRRVQCAFGVRSAGGAH